MPTLLPSRLALVPALLLALTACTKTPEDSGPTRDSEGSDCHPNAPEGYCEIWLVDGCNDGEDTMLYKIGTASSTANGKLEVEEKWYWFFGGDWEEDCVDTIRYTGDRLNSAALQSLNASQAEEGYQGTMSKAEDNCPGVNYLYLWDHPDKDDFDYGDELDQDIVIIFDTLTINGDLNVDNAMLIFMGYDMRGQGYSMRTDYGRGTFLPDTEALEPPAHYTWETQSCLDG